MHLMHLLLAGMMVIFFSRCGKDDTTTVDPSDPFLRISQTLSETPFTAEGGTQTIVFSTNERWIASFESSSIPGLQWHDVTPFHGEAGDNIKISVKTDPNEDKTSRNVTLVLRTLSLEERIEVKQSRNHAVIIGEDHHELTSSGQTLTVDVKPNAAYTIQIKDGSDWIKDNGEKDNKHTFVISPNHQDKKRTGVIVFQDSDTDIFDEVSIVQAAWADIEHKALVAFYNEAGGSGWTRNDNWCSDKPLGEWYGVQTDSEGNVTALRLPKNNLSGTVSWEISGLTMLQHLDLSHNALGGDISKYGSDGKIINYLDNLIELETIDLSHNSITGVFMPVDGSKLLQLKYLDLSFNRLNCFAFSRYWRPMFENGRSVDLILNNNYLYDDTPDYIQDHPDWSRLALQFIRQYVDMDGVAYGGVRYTKDIILPDFTFTDLRDGSKKSIRDLYSSKELTMLLAWDPTQEDSKTFMETTVRRFHTLYKGQGFEVVAIIPEGEKYKQAAEEYLSTHEVPYPVVSEYADAQGRRIILPCEPYPSYFLVDKTGKFSNDMFTGQNYSSDRLPGEPRLIDLINFPFQHTNHITAVFNDVFGLSQYQSTDFSMDKKYETLQHATKGKGIDIVLIGDAYTDIDIETGLYRQVMEFAMESFFLLEPTKSYREYFNVHMVYAVSKNAHEGKSDDDTALGVTTADKKFNTYTATLRLPDYCRAIGKPIPVAGIFVNNKNSGIAHLYSSANSTNYGFAGLGLGTLRSMCRDVFIHETVGHTFGLLADEYTGGNGKIPESEKPRLIRWQEGGYFLNVSLTNDPKSVYWSHLIGHPQYPYVGIHEGGYVYSAGIWRSERDNIMVNQYHFYYFNAICRELIVKRIMKLAGEEFTFEKFMEKDIYEPKPYPNSITPTQQQIKEYRENHRPPIIIN